MTLKHQNTSASYFSESKLNLNRSRVGRIIHKDTKELFNKSTPLNKDSVRKTKPQVNLNRGTSNTSSSDLNKTERDVDLSFKLTEEHKKNILSKMSKILTQIETFLEIRIKFGGSSSLDSLRYRDFIVEYDKLASSVKEVEAKHVIHSRIEKASHSISEFSYFGNYILPNYAVTLNKGFIDKLIVIGVEMYSLCNRVSRAIGPMAMSWGTIEVQLASLIDRYEEENNFGLSNDYMYRIYRLLLLSLHNSDIISAKIFASFIVNQVDILREVTKAGGNKSGV